MNKPLLEDYLKGPDSYCEYGQEKVDIHFHDHQLNVPYGEGTMAVLRSNREFYGKNHILSLHKRNSPNIPMHIFHYFKMNYVLEGKVKMNIDGSEQTLEKGDMIFIEKHEPHSISRTGPNDLMVNVILKDAFFLQYFSEYSSLSRSLQSLIGHMIDPQAPKTHFVLYRTKDDERIMQMMHSVLEEFRDPGPCSAELVDHAIASMILLAQRAYFPITNLLTEKGDKEQLLERILAAIRTNYRNGSLKELCGQLQYNYSYLSVLIKELTGKSYKELVAEQRIEQAKRLLAGTNMPVYQIAEETGYLNLSSFYKMFQKLTGEKPDGFRKRIQHAIDADPVRWDIK